MDSEEFEPKEPNYSVGLSIQDVYLLHHCVTETIKNWPGSPARPYQEQEHLWYLRDNLYRMILEYRFENM